VKDLTIITGGSRKRVILPLSQEVQESEWSYHYHRRFKKVKDLTIIIRGSRKRVVLPLSQEVQESE